MNLKYPKGFEGNIGKKSKFITLEWTDLVESLSTAVPTKIKHINVGKER